MTFFNNPFLKQLLNSFRDLAPILVVILIFQFLVIKQPLPHVSDVLIGSIFVVVGLTLFIQGLELALFPVGEAMAHAFARKGSVVWLLLFAFCLGFGAAIAEPALLAISDKAAGIASTGNLIAKTAQAKAAYALGLRLTIAFSVGVAIVLSVLRILRGWPVHYLIIFGYLSVLTMTWFAPKDIVSMAYDSGIVTVSTITIPLITTLGIGLATAIRGRNPMTDGFGLIAFASLTPIVFVMIYGILR